MSAKGIGGIEISERGFTVWLSDDRGGRWTFRIGGRSGLADLHRSEADDSQETLWVARTSELFGWMERAFTLDVLLPWVDGLTDVVSWAWVHERGIWLAPMPSPSEEETARIAGVLADSPIEQASEREPTLTPAPLPLRQLPNPLAPGAYVAYPDPKSGDESIGVLLWTPGFEGRELLWMDASTLAERAERLVAPYLSDLQAMDRPEVREALGRFLERRERRRA